MCDCGSTHSYDDCCRPFLQGEKAPQTAEQLMRSRYSAYVRADAGYLLATWHSSTCPENIDFSQPVKWLGLEIVGHVDGGAQDERGEVEFKARFFQEGVMSCLHERSRFVREQGQWRYLDGRVVRHNEKIGRNQACPCGSGKKHKQCCGK